MKNLSKEALFEDFVKTVCEVSISFLRCFHRDYSGDLISRAIGVDWKPGFEFNEETLRTAKDHFIMSSGWFELSGLYDYAIDGEGPSNFIPEKLDDSKEILSHLDTEWDSVSESWADILSMAHARYELDFGRDTSINGIALLANVDVRTVRNAISAGELVACKRESVVYATNKSARYWLHGRRGFRPTRHTFAINDGWIENVTEVWTYSDFGSYLANQRENLGVDADDKRLKGLHPSLNAIAINEIEQGIFKLPLDAVIPLADFYQFDRHDFLLTVMKLFFKDEYRILARKTVVKDEDTNDE